MPHIIFSRFPVVLHPYLHKWLFLRTSHMQLTVFKKMMHMHIRQSFHAHQQPPDKDSVLMSV